MTTSYRIDRPDDMTATLSITMTVKEWKELKAQITDQYPSWQLRSAITDVINKASQTIWHEPDTSK